MRDAKSQRRLDMLLQWKWETEALGFTTPGEGQLTSIADSNTVDAAGDAETVVPWSETLVWLLHQLRMGVFDPVSQLPTELKTPSKEYGRSMEATTSIGIVNADALNGATVDGRVLGGDPVFEPVPPAAPATRLDAVKEWRRAAIESGREEVANLKESALVPIARMSSVSASDIAAKLPQSLRGLGPEIAAVLEQFSANDPTAAPSEQVFPPAESPATPRTSVGSVPSNPAPAEPGPAAPGGRSRRGNAPVGSFLDLENEDFEEFDYTSVAGTVHQIKAGTSGGTTTFSWPAYDCEDGDTVVYRLVASSEFPPYAPERASEYVGATVDTKVSDPRGFESAVRYVQVWVNVGVDVDDATGSQPVLHAQTAVVSPVSTMEIREDEGRVIGQWTVFDGISAVQVYRIPVERAAFGGDDPQYRIGAGEPNLGGFVDRTAERGKRYIYRVRAEAPVDGTTRLSAHSQMEVQLSAVLEPVLDLGVVVHGGDDDPQFDLSWTTPAGGRVLIYRTVGGPNSGAESTAIPEASLAIAGLPPENRLSHPIVGGAAGEPSTMTNVPWPRDWNRAYFTAVTLLADQVQVGSTTSATRTGHIDHAQVVERVNKQVLTFAWPAGAASVLVYLGPRGQTADQGISGHPIEISSGMYERFGGLHFPNPLPNGGCALHLIPVAFAGGERIHGQPMTVEYPGLLRVYYDAEIARNVTGKPTSVTVGIAAERDVEGSPPFVLVHNPDRLPLNAHDGSPLSVIPVGNEGAGPSKQFMPPRLSASPDGMKYRAEVKDLVGFVRLFAQMPAARLVTFALMDPPIAKLTLAHGRRR